MKVKKLKFGDRESIVLEPEDGSNTIDVELGGKKPDKIEEIDIQKDKKIKRKLKKMGMLKDKNDQKGRTIKL